MGGLPCEQRVLWGPAAGSARISVDYYGPTERPPLRGRIAATKVMEYAASGMLTAVVECPFPFTTDTVRKAFRLQESRLAHGKVVIRVLAEDARL